MKRFIKLISLLIMMMMISGCQKQESVTEDIYQEKAEETVQEEAVTADESNYPLEIVDKFGNTVVIDKQPEKVISFSPELVEIMYAIDVEEALIGRSTYCDYPEDVKVLPDMGDLFNLNIESIVESGADLILLSSMADEELVNSIVEKGIQVIALDADTNIDGTYYYIETIGEIFNANKEANELVVSMKDEINKINEKVKDLNKPSTYFIISVGEYDSGATGDTFINSIIEAAGATNIAADGTGWMYTIEQVVEKDPDTLICSMYWDTKALVLSTEGYKDLRAISEGKLYEVDENIFSRQGPRIVDAVKVLAEIYHPEVF